MRDHDELAGDELERMLERYARVRLDPGQASTRRARAAVMEEAWRRHLSVERGTGAATRRRGLFAGWGMRRLTGTLAAAVMAGLLVGSSVFAGSRAGGPLYGPRLALDDLMLPADPESRLEAELANAQTRLAEAVDASAREDQGALGASLEAYGRAIAALGSETGPRAERALEAVQVHREVLESVLEDAPAAAVAGLDRAIAQSSTLITRLGVTLSAGDGGPGGKPMSAPVPTATPKPARDPKAAATPKPTRDPKAGATPKPTRDPKSRPTPDPPGQRAVEDESPSP